VQRPALSHEAEAELPAAPALPADAAGEDYMFVEDEDEEGQQAAAVAAGQRGGDTQQACDQAQQPLPAGAAASSGQEGGTVDTAAARASTSLAASAAERRRVVVMKQWGMNLATGETATQQVAGVKQGDQPPPSSRQGRAGRHYAFWR
jgi:hypothetical protein